MEISIIRLDSSPSTNQHAAELLRSDQDLADWTTIVTTAQTEGRGQRGNSWESESGKNLTLSLICKPVEIYANQQFVISQAVALGIVDFLDSFSPDFSIKWPNDIYWKRKKICGILIENTLFGENIKSSVVGIGININQQAFVSDAPNPVSLCQVAGEELDLEFCLSGMLSKVVERIIAARNGVDLSREYLNRLFQYNEEALYLKDGKCFSGKIVGVQQTGRLLVENVDEGCLEKFWFKEVEFVI